MIERIERELSVAASREEAWDAVTSPGWLAEEVQMELEPGGETSFRSGGSVKTGWVEAADAPARLAFWWAADGEPATRVELTLSRDHDRDRTRLRVVECRPLELLHLVGMTLPRTVGRSFGPALVAA